MSRKHPGTVVVVVVVVVVVGMGGWVAPFESSGISDRASHASTYRPPSAYQMMILRNPRATLRSLSFFFLLLKYLRPGRPGTEGRLGMYSRNPPSISEGPKYGEGGREVNNKARVLCRTHGGRRAQPTKRKATSWRSLQYSSTY